jgi:hypothetical protein
MSESSEEETGAKRRWSVIVGNTQWPIMAESVCRELVRKLRRRGTEADLVCQYVNPWFVVPVDEPVAVKEPVL